MPANTPEFNPIGMNYAEIAFRQDIGELQDMELPEETINALFWSINRQYPQRPITEERQKVIKKDFGWDKAIEKEKKRWKKGYKLNFQKI